MAILGVSPSLRQTEVERNVSSSSLEAHGFASITCSLESVQGQMVVSFFRGYPKSPWLSIRNLSNDLDDLGVP